MLGLPIIFIWDKAIDHSLSSSADVKNAWSRTSTLSLNGVVLNYTQGDHNFDIDREDGDRTER
jgi:hypothetical protein